MSRTLPQKVTQKLNELPATPGCYLMLNEAGTVIYVGKAVMLRNRVRSYFHASAQHTEKTLALVAEIRDITWWVTETELEALILENELIKQHWPHYNIRLKDDKQYPYIKVNWQDDFPKVQVVRKVLKDGARYFGPYTSSRAVGQTLDGLRRVFPYLDCNRTITGQDKRACLYLHLKLCGAPCIGAQSREDYREIIRQMMDFLQGDADTVMAELTRRMDKAAEDLNFEHAALYRDRIKAAQRIVEQQKIVNTSLEDEDYIAAAQDERTGDTVVQVLFVRRGRLTGRESFVLEGAEIAAAEEQAAANGSGATGVNLRGSLIGRLHATILRRGHLHPQPSAGPSPAGHGGCGGRVVDDIARGQGGDPPAPAGAKAQADADGRGERGRISAGAAGRVGLGHQQTDRGDQHFATAFGPAPPPGPAGMF